MGKIPLRTTSAKSLRAVRQDHSSSTTADVARAWGPTRRSQLRRSIQGAYIHRDDKPGLNQTARDRAVQEQLRPDPALGRLRRAPLSPGRSSRRRRKPSTRPRRPHPVRPPTGRLRFQSPVNRTLSHSLPIRRSASPATRAIRRPGGGPRRVRPTRQCHDQGFHAIPPASVCNLGTLALSFPFDYKDVTGAGMRSEALRGPVEAISLKAAASSEAPTTMSTRARMADQGRISAAARTIACATDRDVWPPSICSRGIRASPRR